MKWCSGGVKRPGDDKSMLKSEVRRTKRGWSQWGSRSSKQQWTFLYNKQNRTLYYRKYDIVGLGKKSSDINAIDDVPWLWNSFHAKYTLYALQIDLVVQFWVELVQASWEGRMWLFECCSGLSWWFRKKQIFHEAGAIFFPDQFKNQHSHSRSLMKPWS